MSKIIFAIAGAGWRSEFYLRIAMAYPEDFCVSGIYIRNRNTAKRFAEKYPFKIYENYEEFLNSGFDFVVCCVSKTNMTDMVFDMAKRGVKVLSETPIAHNNEKLTFAENELKHLKIQVAEQFRYMPVNAAIKHIVDSGIIGRVNYCQVSEGHGYHGISLIKFFLDMDGHLPKVLCDNVLEGEITATNGRNGLLPVPEERVSLQRIALYDFGTKTAMLDFSYDQYFSPIRKNRILIRGLLGEITERGYTYLNGNEPIYVPFSIKNGNYYGEGLLYENQFKKLGDADEIAIATCLEKMYLYVTTGKEFYSVRQAIEDVKIDLKRE